MKFNQPRLLLTYADKTTANIDNCYIVNQSITIKNTALNDLKSSSSTLTLQLTKDCPEIEKFLAYEKDIKVQLLDTVEGASVPFFTGYLTNKFDWKVQASGIESLNITVEDVGTRLLPKNYSKSNSDIYFKGTVSELVDFICIASGVKNNPNSYVIGNEVSLVIKNNTTCKDILTEALYECGCFYYFNNEGLLTIEQLNLQSETVDYTFDSTNLSLNGQEAITVNKSIKTYHQAKVEWDSVEEVSSVLVYQDISGRDDSHPYCYIELQAGESYPASDDTFSFIEATDLTEGKEIINIDNVVPEVEGNIAGLDVVIEKYSSTQIKVKLKNNSGLTMYITKLQAKADVVRVVATNYTEAGEPIEDAEASDNVYNLESIFYYDDTKGQEYSKYTANLLANYYKYCNFKYTFYGLDSVDAGSLVRLVDNTHSGLDVKVLITSAEYSSSKNYVRYQGVSYSQFNLDENVISSKVDYPSAIIPGPPGQTGSSGWSTAQVRLLKKGTSTPPNYSGSEVRYTFATGTVEFLGDDDGWSVLPPSGSGDLYVIYASATSQGINDLISPNEWTSPVVLSTEATPGQDGANVASVFIYKASDSSPVLPTGVVTYRFNGAIIEGLNNGWSKEVPSADKVYISVATAYSTSSSDTIQPSEWSTPVVFKEKGAQGPTGPSGPTGPQGPQGVGIASIVSYYAVSSSKTTTPSNFSTTVPTMTSTNRYLWSYERINFTNSTYIETAKVVIGVYGDKGDKGDQGEEAPNLVYVASDINAYVFPANTSGVVSSSEYKKFISTIVVFQGTTAFNAVSNSSSLTSGTFYLTTRLDGITNISVSGAKVMGTDSTVMLNDTAEVAIDVTYQSLEGLRKTITVRVSLSKSRKGDTGSTGLAGQYTAYQYYASTSSTTQTGGQWQDTMPSISGGKFLWMRTQVVPAGGSISSSKWGTPVLAGSDISALVADIEEVDDRVTQNTAAINVNSEAIATKVDSTTYTSDKAELEQEIGSNTSAIQQNAQAITTKVDNTVYTTDKNNINQAIASNTSAIEQNAQAITTKVSQTDFDDTVSTIESSITQTADMIALRVTQDGDVINSTGLVVGIIEDESYILLDATKVIVPNSITAKQIDAESLFSEHIRVGNSISAGGYDEEGNSNGTQGFYLDKNGRLLAYTASLSDTKVNGTFTCSDTEGVVFSTQQGSGIEKTVTCTAPTHWNSSTIFDSIPVNTTGTCVFKGVTYNFKRASTSSYLQLGRWISTGGIWDSKIEQTKTITVPGNYIVRFRELSDNNYEPYITVKLNGSTVYNKELDWGEGSDVKINVACNAGDSLYIYMLGSGNLVGSGSQEGTINYVDSNYLYLYQSDLFNGVGVTYDVLRPQSEGFEVSGKYDSDNHITYATPNGWLDGLTEGDKVYYLAANSNLVINGIQEEVSQVKKTGDSLTVYPVSKSPVTMNRDSLYYIAGNLLLITEVRGNITETLIPSNSNSSVGVSYNRFARGYYTNLDATTINTQGTTNIVWGAVAN